MVFAKKADIQSFSTKTKGGKPWKRKSSIGQCLVVSSYAGWHLEALA
jgi:hypothetical protein